MSTTQSNQQDWFPLEPDQHDQQAVALKKHLTQVTKCSVGGEGAKDKIRILDLGCGNGRTLLPLAELGYDCTGIDTDSTALVACNQLAEKASIKIKLIPDDFTKSNLPITGPFDLITCLGNTWMLITDPMTALQTLKRITELLNPIHGIFVIDNFPEDLWPCVADGSWCNGISEDNSTQMVWETNDNVFTLRHGDAVNPNRPQIEPDDTRYRLWTMGQLRLLASQAGLQPPQIDRTAHLIRMQPEND